MRETLISILREKNHDSHFIDNLAALIYCVRVLLTGVHLNQNLPLVHLVEVEAVEVVQGELAVSHLKHSTIYEQLAQAHRCHGTGSRAGLHQGQT